MNEKQLDIIKNSNGFIAALDQSGGSTPKALKNYGINEDAYNNEEEMFELVHKMRTRIIKSPSFVSTKVIGAILFEQTMDSKIDGEYTADYLWNQKGVVPFLKVDQGLDTLANGVQLMKPFTKLDALLEKAASRNIFGTKMRSLIQVANKKGIEDVVNQQFEIAIKIAKAGFVPIIEPEVEINSPDKSSCEVILKEELLKHLKNLPSDLNIMFKLTLPNKDNFYEELMSFPQVIRVVALSGGYSRDFANEKLKANKGIIASFSRALSENLNANQNDAEFDLALKEAVDSIFEASI